MNILKSLKIGIKKFIGPSSKKRILIKNQINRIRFIVETKEGKFNPIKTFYILIIKINRIIKEPARIKILIKNPINIFYTLTIKIKRIIKEPARIKIIIKNQINRFRFIFEGKEGSFNPVKIVFDNSDEKYYTFEKNEKLETVVKLIAFYLPQFHPFKENDEWWGKGFTEWTNVTKASSKFIGHYQPRLPTDLGFYDLRLPQIMRDQWKIAENYGIHAFSFYFYWFGGKVLMEKPLQNLLEDKTNNLKFCFTWANENWTRRWDGLDKEVLISQKYSEQDSLDFIRYISKYFRDKRYLKVNGNPILIVYSPNNIPNINHICYLWRKEIQKEGFKDIYLISCTGQYDSKFQRKKELSGFDASLSFVPRTLSDVAFRKNYSLDKKNEEENIEFLDNKFKGNIFDYSETVNNIVQRKENKIKQLESVMFAWDNTARRGNDSNLFINFNLTKYKQWLSHVCHKTLVNDQFSYSEKFVFINAWNEWAEGTYLEPDRKYGYGYLKTTYETIKNFNIKNVNKINFNNNQTLKRYALLIHIHYEEVLDQIIDFINSSIFEKFDIFVTSTSISIIERLKDNNAKINTMLVENRGRDTLPLIYKLSHIKNSGYEAVCIFHSKKSVYRKDGDAIRNQLYEGLFGTDTIVKEYLDIFSKNKKVGLVAPENCLIKHTDANMAANKKHVNLLSKITGVKFYKNVFPAGSMFWARPDSLEPLLSLKPENFEVEEGISDGLMQHAVERMFCIFVKSKGYKVLSKDYLGKFAEL